MRLNNGFAVYCFCPVAPIEAGTFGKPIGLPKSRADSETSEKNVAEPALLENK